MWHIRPQHYPTNQLCQLLPFVPQSSSSIQLFPFLSLSAFLLHVVFGLPRFRRLSGVQVNEVLQSLFVFFRMMWPMNFHHYSFNNIHEKKLLDSDWLGAVQFKCNTSANYKTKFWILIGWKTMENVINQSYHVKWWRKLCAERLKKSFNLD